MTCCTPLPRLQVEVTGLGWVAAASVADADADAGAGAAEAAEAPGKASTSVVLAISAAAPRARATARTFLIDFPRSPAMVDGKVSDRFFHSGDAALNAGRHLRESSESHSARQLR